ncbi:dihydrouridine synthase 1 [Arctopsyche grandis]|uniref:dihydrouridine synthase 1 n=1 Tax=Arctopsyche grandis TaxID=121162 RepID=UPI00406D6D73
MKSPLISSARYVVAPMVDASELPWRLLCRRHCAQLCYTPMLHSNVFCRDVKYRKDALMSCSEDRPLIVQFCGNDPDILLQAALLAEPHCDAIDINLGCPQAIARRGRYGAFLQDEWSLLQNIVGKLSQSLSIPVTCKVRVFEDISKTVEYAMMLQNAGCQLLTVHGRTREQKGPLTGLASWKHIKAVREAVSIPIFANGNIQYLEDVHRCLEATGVNGVMSAEGILTNPALFEGTSPPVWEPGLEYLQLVEKYPCPSSYTRGHIFKMCHILLGMDSNSQVRSELATAQTLEDFNKVVNKLKDKYLPYHLGEKVYYDEAGEPKEEHKNDELNDCNLKLPPWICQPYVRIPPSEHIKKMEEKKIEIQNGGDELKRHYEDSEGNIITRKKMKKLRRIQRRPIKAEGQQIKRNGDICENCPNPLGMKCLFKLCKKCCKNKCFNENSDCPGHRILVKTRREMAQKYAAERNGTVYPKVQESNLVT